MKQFRILDTTTAKKLANDHKAVLKSLNTIRINLRDSFADMDEAVNALVLAVLSGEALLFVGKPGTAKSNLIRLFCQHIGILTDNPNGSHKGYFEYLMTPFTEPSELFGYFDVAKAINSKELVRDDDNMMQKAEVVYLDEVFNGSSAILNSLLAFMNEGIFHDRGRVHKVALKSLFAATNHVPETPELRAVFDRFLLRCEVTNVQPSPDNVKRLLTAGWSTTYTEKRKPNTHLKFLPEIDKFREAVRKDAEKLMKFNSDDGFMKAISFLVGNSRAKRLSDVSNRRLIKFQFVLATHAIFRAAVNDSDPMITSEDLYLWRFILDRSDGDIEGMIGAVIQKL
jgi:Mg-chelatase subunit ChlI